MIDEQESLREGISRNYAREHFNPRNLRQHHWAIRRVLAYLVRRGAEKLDHWLSGYR